MKDLIINAPFIEEVLSANKIVVVDGGAKGELFTPFNQVNKSVFTVLRFEPNSEAEITKNDNEIIFNKALWNSTGKIKINIAKDPSTSSVFDIDVRILKQIDPNGIDARMPQKTIEVDCCSIDELCKTHQVPYPDFIKLDIHGSEYEALEGAKESLANATFGALVETWTLPIHKGQKTHGQVESLLNESSIYLFEHFPLIEWTRQAKGTRFYKTQIGGYDALFFKDIIGSDSSSAYTMPQVIKCISMADLFGHHAFALQIADYFNENKILSTELYDKIRNFIIRKESDEKLKVKWLQKVYLKSLTLLNKTR